MQNSFIQAKDGKIIIDQAQFMMYAIAAAALVLVIVVLIVALKRRKKNFIKTLPTNIKNGE